MNLHDHETVCGLACADRGQLSRLSGLVSAAIGRRVRDLLIEVCEGGLVLRGRADSYHVKQLAQHAAMAATGLPLVANRIEVARARGTPLAHPARSAAGEEALPPPA